MTNSFVWKRRCVGSLIACWSLEPVSSSRTTSAFPAASLVAVSLVTSCAVLLRWHNADPSHLAAVALWASLASASCRAITIFDQELKYQCWTSPAAVGKQSHF